VTDSEVKEKERLDIPRRLAKATSLLGRFPAHESSGEVCDALAGEDGANALGDRQLHAEPMR
jgi:hypothetical protein